MSLTETILTLLLVTAILTNVFTVIAWKKQSPNSSSAGNTRKLVTKVATAAEKEALVQNATHAIDRTMHPTVYGTLISSDGGPHVLMLPDGSRFRDYGTLRRL